MNGWNRGWITLLVVTALSGCSKSPEQAAAPVEAETPASAPTVAMPSPAAPPTAAASTTEATASNYRAPSPTTPSSYRSTSSQAVVPAGYTAPIAPKVPTVDPEIVLHTSLGDLTVRLYENQAPRTVANFIDYARVGHYNGTIFHQVDPGYVAVGGAFDEKMQAKPVRYPVKNEAANGLKNVRGSLAMARDPGDPNSARAMFFINLADNAKLDHQGSTPETFGYCVFGQVIGGLDVLDKMAAVPTSAVGQFPQMPSPAVVLTSIKSAPPKQAAVESKPGGDPASDNIHHSSFYAGFGR